MKRLLIFVTCLLLALALEGQATDIHVSPKGDDNNPGTAQQPVASLQAAQQLVREQVQAGLRRPVNVLIHPGTYELAQALELRPEDSGTEKHPITWRAADRENMPVLSGGRVIKGKWMPSERKGIWYIDLPDAKNALPPRVDPNSIRLTSGQALLEGKWQAGELQGSSYHVASANGKGAASCATYRLKSTEEGQHQLKLANVPHSNRSNAVPVEVVVGKNTVKQTVDQRRESTIDLGTYDLDADQELIVKIFSAANGGYAVAGDIVLKPVHATKVQAEGWNFRQLFVNEQRAIRARYPNKDEANPFLYAKSGGKDHAVIESALVKAAWGEAPDAQINIVPAWKFFNQWNTVTSVDPQRGRIDIADSERHGTIKAGNWFWIEGVLEELDQPGEWYLDPVAGRLYYMPDPGVDPNDLTIVAPRLNRIINARGDVNTGTHVQHVHFEGLAFRHTTFTLGHIEARVHTDTAVMFENTHHSSVKNCSFENIGGYALWLHLDSQRNVFDRNTVRNSGGGGVLATGSRFSYMDDTKVYTPGEAAAKVAPILNHITRNTVEHCGQIRYYGGGVHLDSRPFSMSMEPGNYIAHNHFNDLSRNGVFAFRNQGGNIVEYNHIHNTMQTTIDGGCIHFATMNHLNAPNYILNNWLHDIWGYNYQPNGEPKRVLANGVFLDWDTSNTTVRDNYVHNSGGDPIKVIWENVNVTVQDNHVTDSPPPFVDQLGPDGTASNMIDLETTGLIGSVVHYTDEDRVQTTEGWTPRTATGLSGLFEFNYLVGSPEVPAEATFSLPIPTDGTYQIWLLYTPHANRASNAPLSIRHARGTSEVQWNMRTGSRHGFAVRVGQFDFEKESGGSVTFTTTGADGLVIVDGGRVRAG